MPPLLIATTNEGKMREIRQVLQPLDWPLCSLRDVPPVPEPEETGATFAENARIKALAYAAATGLPTVAEDSGLAIDALGGAPGIHSARYPGATYPEKFANLYRALASHPSPWTARYVCAVALVHNGQVRVEYTGTVEGQIAPAPRGRHGFGYDPIFEYPPYGATFGEIDDARKLEVAHRGRAFRLFLAWCHQGGLAETIRA